MKGFKELDRILRGEAAKPGEKPTILPLLVANILLAAFYGLCMGIYGLSSREEPEYRQMLADAVKVPLLFILTLFVTFPSLYVFNALVGSRLKLLDLARLITAALGVVVALLAAFGPIVGFFSVTTNNYPFVVLLNVAVFTLSAAFGLAYLLRALNRLLPVATPKYAPPAPRATRVTSYIEQISETTPVEPPVPPVEVPEPEPDPAPPPAPRSARVVITVWLIVFALVGAQMSWVLRPFIGSPNVEFSWFRPRGSSFFEAVSKAVRMLFN